MNRGSPLNFQQRIDPSINRPDSFRPQIDINKDDQFERPKPRPTERPQPPKRNLGDFVKEIVEKLKEKLPLPQNPPTAVEPPKTETPPPARPKPVVV